MTQSASTQGDPKADLDALIREAELRIIAADREWQRHGDQLTVTLRGHAGTAKKASVWGGIGLAAAAVGTGLLSWRSKAKARAEARTVVGRAKGVAQGVAATVADKWSGLTARVPAPVAPPRRPTSRIWEVVVTTVGLLLGAAARSGLKTSATGSRRGVVPMIVSVGLPMLSRWMRSQQTQQPQPPVQKPPRSRR